MDNAASRTSVSDAATADISGKEYRKLGFSLYVWLSENRLECRCSYVPREQGSMMTRDELAGYLAQSYVREGIIPEALDDFAVKAAAGQTLKMVLLAEGVAPTAGEDGWLEYTAQPSVTIVHDIDQAENVDLHNVQTFINVTPGDEIGRIRPPQPGTLGRNVMGEVIPPQDGKPLNLKIGANIRCDDTSRLLATAAGRVCAAGGEISVAQEYVVAGDVNFRVGSIVFNGFVEVRGDILDGFNVTAVKGLRVNGNIGACAIRSDGDISFCGMDGREQGSIECGGSISANFIHNCAVVASGDVQAEVELHNCHIRSLGRIVTNKGAIAGGSYTALAGIETKKAGSASSIRTVLRAGLDYRDMAELELLLAEQEENSAQIRQAASLHEREELRKKSAELSAAIAAIRSRADERANPKINVKTILYDNTFLHVGLAPKQKVDERDGPFSVIEDTINGGLRFLALTSLDVSARDIELAFVREQALKR